MTALFAAMLLPLLWSLPLTSPKRERGYLSSWLWLLGSRALCYHLKDYRIVGSNVGFPVAGAPLGAGQFDVDGFLAAVLAKGAAPQLFLETWTPQSGDRERDILLDAAWLRQSVEYLQGKLRG